MYEWRVRLTYMTHYVIADDYSVAGDRDIFWDGQVIVRSFPADEVINVDMVRKI
jgi:hypothetical protein